MRKTIKVVCALLIVCLSANAQEENPIEPSWGSQVEVNYISLNKKSSYGWYAASEYGSRFAPKTIHHLVMVEGGAVFRLHKATVFLLGIGGEYSFIEKRAFFLGNSTIENDHIGIGCKYIFMPNACNFEITALKYFTINHIKLGAGGGYLSKDKIPIVKLAVLFD